MGVLRFVFEFFKFSIKLIKGIKESKEKDLIYMNMSKEEMLSLSEDDLFEAVSSRVEQNVESFDEEEDGFNSLNVSQKIFYSLNWLEMEVNNGGLCQFFVNSSRMVAPYISEYMSVVGANEHKKLFDKFVNDNNIDLCNLSSFDVDDVDEYEEQTERYPFDDYDDAFYDMEPLETYLKQFIKEHIEDF